MHRPEKKAPAERSLSLPAKVLQWVRRRPAAAALLLLGTTVTVVLVVALVSSLAAARDTGPPVKPYNQFLKRQQMQGGPRSTKPTAAQAR
jgi:hypothetical protein